MTRKQREVSELRFPCATMDFLDLAALAQARLALHLQSIHPEALGSEPVHLQLGRGRCLRTEQSVSSLESARGSAYDELQV